MSIYQFSLSVAASIREWLFHFFRFITHPVFKLLPSSDNVGEVEAKPSYHSRVTMTEIVLPSHCDIRGYIYGGNVMAWIDIAAGMAAKRHARYPCVTRTVDDVHFLQPIRTGDIVTIQATVNRAWNTSMEVGVRVETENCITGKSYYSCHAYLTFVALSPKPLIQLKTSLGRALQQHIHKPVRVPAIIPNTDIEHTRYKMAGERRQARFQRKDMDVHLDRLRRIRELMKEWSYGRQKHPRSEAVVFGVEAVSNATLHFEPDTLSDGAAEKFEDGKLINSNDVQDNEEIIENASKAFWPPRRQLSLTPASRLPQPKEKSIESSYCEVVELVLPQHANTLGITFGGQIMKWMEMAAIGSASRFGRSYLLTVSIDSLNFLHPTRVGDMVTCRSIISRSFRSSVEVYVTVEADNTSGETIFTNDAFITIVAVDRQSSPVKIPRAIPQSNEEFALYEGGLERRKRRLEQRRELILREGLAFYTEDRKSMDEAAQEDIFRKIDTDERM